MNATKRIVCLFGFAIGTGVLAGSAMAFDLGGLIKEVQKAAQQQEPQGQPVQQQPQKPQGQPVQQRPESNPPVNANYDLQEKNINEQMNQIFLVLNSAKLKNAYTVCKKNEVERMSNNLKRAIPILRKEMNDAATVEERDKLAASIKEAEALPLTDLAPAACLIKLSTRAQRTLNKEAPDFTDLQDVSNALKNGSFTEKFYSDVSTDLRSDYIVWIKEFVIKPQSQLINFGANSDSTLRTRAEKDDYIQRVEAKFIKEYEVLATRIWTPLKEKLVTP